MERKDIGLCIFGALLLGVTYLSSFLAIFELVVFSVYFYIVFKYEKKKGMFQGSFLFFFIFFGIVNLFLFEVLPLDFMDVNPILGTILVGGGYLILCLIMALIYQIPYLVLRFTKHNRVQGYALVIITLTLLEGLLEYLGYPLFKMALPLASFPYLIQCSAFIGISGCSLVVYVINALVHELWHYRNLKMFGFIVMIGILNFIVSLNIPHIDALNEGVVTLIQANVGSNQKWDKSLDEANFMLHYNLSAAYIDKSDLIVWPETAIPFNQTEFSNQALLSDNMIIGSFDEVDNKKYNALVNMRNNQLYYKRYLVPIGEYIPQLWGTLLPLLNDFQLGSTLTPGDENVIFDTSMGDAGALICFESMVSNLAVQNVRDGATFMIVVSNDSWFNDIEKELHFKHAIFRAIETRKPFVRVGNTGTTAIIDAYGNTVAIMANDTYGALSGVIKTNDYQSFYVQYKDFGKWLLLFGLIFLVRIDRTELKNFKMSFYR